MISDGGLKIENHSYETFSSSLTELKEWLLSVSSAFTPDIHARRNAVKQAISKSKQGSAPVYLFLFTWKPSVNALGASHGMELPFMFNNVDLQREMTGGTDDAYRLADIMSSAWISFIKTGDPNTKGLPRWTPFTEENGATMIFDNRPQMKQHHDKAILDYQMPGFMR